MRQKSVGAEAEYGEYDETSILQGSEHY